LCLINLFVILRTEVLIMKEPYSKEQIQLARFAKALGHPVRVYIIELLSKQSCCYSGDLSDVLPIAKSTLSQHLKELKEAGLIQGEIEPPKIKYCINKDNWEIAQLLFKKYFKI
jgi:DNA-binding transcriptional ArsR family regulator